MRETQDLLNMMPMLRLVSGLVTTISAGSVGYVVEDPGSVLGSNATGMPAR